MTVKQLVKLVEVHSGIPSGLRMIRLKRKKKQNKKLRIVFLCQMEQIWGCLQTVYEAAEADEGVEPYILAVPEYREDGSICKRAYEYMRQSGYPVIDAYDEKSKKLYDLRRLRPDYVFLPRPYDNYLPEQYQSGKLSFYTKVCYLCYGYTAEGAYMLKTCFSKHFIGNCYMVFAENESVRKYCVRQLPFSSRIGLHKIIKTPFPRFDFAKKYENGESKAWKRARGDVNKRIIWTPRWTLEEKLGGTGFFDYKDFLFEFAEAHEDADFLFRPHPLAFDNFVRAGAMTEKEVEAFKTACDEAPNIQLDTDAEYLQSFASADILVSDLSGVVVDFAVTGKPVVFCNPEVEYNAANAKLLDAYYLVRNQRELKETLEMLCSGKDPKRKQRFAIVRRVLGTCDGNNGRRILECIKKDYGSMSV